MWYVILRGHTQFIHKVELTKLLKKAMKINLREAADVKDRLLSRETVSVPFAARSDAETFLLQVMDHGVIASIEEGVSQHSHGQEAEPFDHNVIVGGCVEVGPDWVAWTDRAEMSAAGRDSDTKKGRALLESCQHFIETHPEELLSPLIAQGSNISENGEARFLAPQGEWHFQLNRATLLRLVVQHVAVVPVFILTATGPYIALVAGDQIFAAIRCQPLPLKIDVSTTR